MKRYQFILREDAPFMAGIAIMLLGACYGWFQLLTQHSEEREALAIVVLAIVPTVIVIGFGWLLHCSARLRPCLKCSGDMHRLPLRTTARRGGAIWHQCSECGHRRHTGIVATGRSAIGKATLDATSKEKARK